MWFLRTISCKFNMYAYLCYINCSLYITYCIQYVTYKYTYLLSVRFAASLCEVYIACFEKAGNESNSEITWDQDRVYGADVFSLQGLHEVQKSVWTSCFYFWQHVQVLMMEWSRCSLWPSVCTQPLGTNTFGSLLRKFVVLSLLRFIGIYPQASLVFFASFHYPALVVVTCIAEHVIVICDRDSRCCPPAETCTHMAYYVCIVVWYFCSLKPQAVLRSVTSDLLDFESFHCMLALQEEAWVLVAVSMFAIVITIFFLKLGWTWDDLSGLPPKLWNVPWIWCEVLMHVESKVEQSGTSAGFIFTCLLSKEFADCAVEPGISGGLRGHAGLCTYATQLSPLV